MSALWYHLTNAVCLQVSGKDARRYLQNRLSNDLRALEPGASTLAAALNPQGRVEGLFAVFLDAEERFFLLCDGGARQAIFSAVGRYIVADRVSIEDSSSRVVWLHIVRPIDEAREVCEGLSGVRIFAREHQRLGAAGCDVLAVGENAASVVAGVATRFGSQLSEREYELRRCMWGEPAFPSEVNDQAIITECGLREAVSFTKGCYVGQEVIERSDAIGKLPRTLARVVVSGGEGVSPGSAIESGSGEVIGRVVSAVPDPESGTTYAFALLRSGKYSAGEEVRCSGSIGTVVETARGRA